MEFIEFLWRIGVALLLGAIIGLERNKRVKGAGIRTHGIVSVGACLFMLISQYAYEGVGWDASRIASTVVTGVGFLGVGIIYNKSGAMQGLTTAAGVWTTAAIGMCCGSSNITFILVAVAVTVIIVLFQLMFYKPLKFLAHKVVKSVKIKFICNQGMVAGDLSAYGKITGYSIKKEEKTICSCVIMLNDSETTTEIIDELIDKFPQIISAEFIIN